jgi:hypothetical protein
MCIKFVHASFIFSMLKIAVALARFRAGCGTVFGVVDGKPKPVCDYAGFAPIGFSYRRRLAEQLTIQVFENVLPR